MQFLKQSTGVDVRMGPAVDASDGVTPETTLALATADQAEILKHNGAATVDISAATMAAVTGCDGWYDLTLTTSHTDTLGQMTIVIQDSSLMLPIFRDFMVIPANEFDSLISGTDALDVEVASVASAAITADAIATDAIGAAELATDAVNEIVDQVWNEAKADHVAAGSMGELLSDILAIDTQIYSDTTLLVPAASDIESSLVIVKSDLVVVDAAVSDVESSLVIVKSDIVLIYSDTTHIDSDIVALATAADVADAVWDESTTGHDTAGTFGALISDMASDLVVIESDTTVIEAAGGALTAAQASQLAQIRSDLIIAASDVVQIYSDTTILVPGVSDIESSLVIVKSDLVVVDAAVSDVESSLVIIKSDLTVAEGERSDITSDLVLVQAAISDVESSLVIVKSDLVIVQSDLAIFDASRSEPTGVPAADASPLTKIDYLFMGWRNQATVTADKFTQFDSTGAAEFERDLSDDGTTYTQSAFNAL